MQPISGFSYFLRTGRRLPSGPPLQVKYNHWHDTENGQFTFDGRGRYFGAASSAPGKLAASSKPLKLVQYQRNPRVRMGGNGGPPLQDPSTLEHAFPGVGRSPAGTIIGLADNFLDLTGPARALTTEFSQAYVRKLVSEIRTLDPSYVQPDAGQGGFPVTSEGQANLINKLRMDRAKLYYRRGDFRPYQIETFRFVQIAANEEYEIGIEKIRSGRLPVHISVELTLGNYVDGSVRARTRKFHTANEVLHGRGYPTQVNNNAPNTPDGSYTRPDSRVGDIAIDVTLERKTLGYKQIKGFFNSDFQPTAVIIIRPRQLGPNSTYIITKPSGR